MLHHAIYIDMENINYLDAKEVKAGMTGYFLILYPDGTYEFEKDQIIDEVLDGSNLSKNDFNDLKELGETYGDQFQDFEISDYKGHTICMINHHIYLYDEEISKNGTYYRLLVPESERWKSSDKLTDMNDKTGIFENTISPFLEIKADRRERNLIIEGHISKDAYITYGVYLTGPDIFKEFMEFYSGENYKVGSSAKSFSKFYTADEIPLKYKERWNYLKEYAIEKFPDCFSAKLVDWNKKTGIFEMKHLKSFKDLS